MVRVILTSQEIEETKLTENFYNAMRGFIVIEESGLPKYIEFLTEEKIDVILLAGVLSGLQSLAEVISEEKIRTIETSNSKFIFKIRKNFFYVLWIEKRIENIDLYEPIIMKIISRFEGASSDDIENSLLISNLTETPDYEKFGQRITKFRSMDAKYTEAYKKLLEETSSSDEAKRFAEELSGIDGVMVLSDEGETLHLEFPRGEPIFDIGILTNFLVGLRKSIKNLDPGKLEEVTTENYRFLVQDSEKYFYVFEVIKGLANEDNLMKTIQKIISRYEGLKRKDNVTIELLKDLESIPEHEILGQLSLEMRDRQSTNGKNDYFLDRKTSKITIGGEGTKWAKEDEQLNSFMAIFSEIFMTGIIIPNDIYFITKKTPNINDWIQSAKGIILEKLLKLTRIRPANQITCLSLRDKEFLVLRITDSSVLFVILDQMNSAIERYMLRLPAILRKISKNII